jgi:hypothetical protein
MVYNQLLGPGDQDFFGPYEMALSRQANAIWAQKSRDFQDPTPLPLAQIMDLRASKALHTGPHQSEVHR